jgi:NaMN:DMB phosphoribosyltransferase
MTSTVVILAGLAQLAAVVVLIALFGGCSRTGRRKRLGRPE